MPHGILKKSKQKKLHSVPHHLINPVI